MRTKKAQNARGGKSNVQHSSDTFEHFTPRDIVERARMVFDKRRIDLDPASCPEANLVVGAKRIFTEADDGLTQPWKARRVFVNPPGGAEKNEGERQKSRARLWWEYAVDEWKSGRAGCIIFVAFSVELFKSGQMNTIAPYAFPFVVPDIRLQFDGWDPVERVRVPGTAPTHSNAIILLPDARDPLCIKKFARYFEDCGHVKTTMG